MNIPDEVKKKIEEESAEKYADVNYNDLDEYKTLWEHLKTAHLAGYRLAKSEAVPEYPDPKIKAAADIFEADDEAVPSGDDERDAEDARKAKGYKDSENFYDPYLDTAIVERKKSDAFRDGFLAGRKGMVPASEVERRVAEAVQKERERCWSVMCDDAKLFETVPNSFFDCVEHDILNPPEQS